MVPLLMMKDLLLMTSAVHEDHIVFFILNEIVVQNFWHFWTTSTGSCRKEGRTFSLRNFALSVSV